MPFRIFLNNPIDNAWRLYHLTYQSMWKWAEDMFAKTDLTHQQFVVLVAIKENSLSATPTVIASWLDRNPNSITLIIDRMEKKGLVQRVRDLEDRRALRLTITPKGEKIFEQTVKSIDNLPSEIFSMLTEEELLTFTNILYKIREKTFDLRNIKDKVTNVNVNH